MFAKVFYAVVMDNVYCILIQRCVCSQYIANRTNSFVRGGRSVKVITQGNGARGHDMKYTEIQRIDTNVMSLCYLLTNVVLKEPAFPYFMTL